MFHCWQTWLNLFAQCSNIYIVIMNFATKNSLQWDNFCTSHTLTLFSNFIFRGKTQKTWTIFGIFLEFSFWIEIELLFLFWLSEKTGKIAKKSRNLSSMKSYQISELKESHTIYYHNLQLFHYICIYSCEKVPKEMKYTSWVSFHLH